MSKPLDLITLEVVRNAFPAIANEMAADLQRTSYNMMIYEVRDFCTAVIDTKGALVSQNVGGVSHFVADLGTIIVDAMDRFGAEGFAAGDVVITNHQAVAGQHLNNIVIYAPYFRGAELLFFTMVRAHWIDVGGSSTGFGAGAQCRDPWIEGLQLDQLKIYEAGILDRKLYKVISDNIRFPESSMGDMRSAIAACRLANRRLEELFERYGRDTILAANMQIFKETEAKCRYIVEKIPDGVYEAEAFYDNDTVTKDEKIRLHAKVTVDGGHMTIDLSGCSGERKAAINARTFAGARVAYKALTAPLEPVNEGSFSALDVIIPEGNVMMARFPAPMASWSSILPTVVDTIVAALAPALPDRIPAAHHGQLGGVVVFGGFDPVKRRNFVIQSIEGGGWGGHPTKDGESASVSVCQGDVRTATIEGLEIAAPILVEQRAVRRDSGGAGRFRGGLGQDLTVRNLVEGWWHLPENLRNFTPPWGLQGGKPGMTGCYLARLPGENDFTMRHQHRFPVPAQAEASIRTAGGGGWGAPFERPVDRVLDDVVEGLVSVEQAREAYGVAIEAGPAGQFMVDAEQTRRLRGRAA